MRGRLGLLHELMPQAKAVTVLYNPKFAAAESELHDVQLQSARRERHRDKFFDR
jgi:ABC-type uncharacterized transport system substrate-binding protein